jgi:hypothetical protein
MRHLLRGVKSVIRLLRPVHGVARLNLFFR